MANDPIKRLRAGQPITEGWLGHLVDAVNLRAAGGHVFVDSTGVYHRPDPRSSVALRRFELTENLTCGSNATAYLLKWTGAAYVAQSSVEFEVYDPFSQFCQYSKPTGQDGARGMAQFMWDRGVWEIVELQMPARKIKFAATEDFTSGEANVTVDGVVYYNGYTPDTGITSVENPGWAGLDNDLGLAFLNINDGKYYIESMITVATDIMVGHRIDDSNNKKFETLWQQFYMRAAETTTSDWRTDHTGADCS